MDLNEVQRAVNRLADAVNAHDTAELSESLGALADAFTDEHGPVHRIAAALETLARLQVEAQAESKRKGKRRLKAVGS